MSGWGASTSLRLGTGYYLPRRNRFAVATECGLALFGLLVWGPFSTGAAVLVAPILYRALRCCAFAGTFLLLAVALKGTSSRLTMCAYGPVLFDAISGRGRFALHRDPTLAHGFVLAGYRAQPGHARLAERLRWVCGALLLIVGTLSFVALMRLISTGSVSPLLFLEVAAASLLLPLLVMNRMRRGAEAAAEPSERTAEAMRELTAQIARGERLRQLSDELIEQAFGEASWGPARAGGNLLTYFVMADRGNWAAAAQALDLALLDAETWRRSPIQVPFPIMNDIYGTAAAHLAWFSGDLARAEATLQIAAGAWMSRSVHALAQATIALRRGAWMSAGAAARDAVAAAKSEAPSSTALVIADWAEAVRSAAEQCMRGAEPSPGADIAFSPPIILSPTRLRRWFSFGERFCLAALPFFVLMLGWSVAGAWNGSVFALSVSGIVVATVGASFARAYLDGSTLELSPDDILIRTSRMNARYAWRDVTGVGRLGRAPWRDLGLHVDPAVAAQLPRGAFKGGVPVAAFESNWRQGFIGGQIRRFAPHVMGIGSNEPMGGA